LWQQPNLKQADVALLGVPVHKSSITPQFCRLALTAIPGALVRTSTYFASSDVDQGELKITDLGDVTGVDCLVHH
jgi:arginase family enzyme